MLRFRAEAFQLYLTSGQAAKILVLVLRKSCGASTKSLDELQKAFSNRKDRDTCPLDSPPGQAGGRCQGEREVFKGLLGVLCELRGSS